MCCVCRIGEDVQLHKINDLYSVQDVATTKILTEVARIGHDYAFGKGPNDLFERVEKQLPVVFTLQDDVGDT